MRRRLCVSLLLAVLSSGASGCGDGAANAKHGGDSSPPATESHGPASGDVPPSAAPASQSVRGLPDDIPIPEGLRSTSVQSEEPGSVVALFTGDLEPDDVARQFADGLRRSGWSIDESRKGDDLGLFAHKQERIASVVVTRLSGRLHVELGVWAPKD